MIGEFFKNIADNVGGAIIDGLRSLCYWLDTFIYNLIIYIYNWFVMLCNGRILDFDVVKNIADRFGLILGVFMFFTVAISFLRMILDPDKMNDKEMGMGAIVKKVILVVVMLGLSNTVFEFAYDFQKVVLGNNANGTSVIQNLLSPYKVDSRDFGVVLSTNLFTSFYDVEEAFEENFADSYQEISDCRNYHTALKNSIMTNHNFSLGYNCLNVKINNVSYGGVTSGQTSSEYVMRFESILSVIVGVFVLWMIFSYTIKVGVRMVQLTFLEIISPMAIISYLSPKKDTMFSKWGKIYISTYIDVFVRVAIINLVVYLISVILDGWSTGTGYFWDSLNVIDMTGTTKMYIGIIMILALLTFAQRAPELLKEILPSGGPGSIGFGVGKKGNEGIFQGLGSILGAGTGAVVGAIGGLAGGKGLSRVSGLLGGAVGGLARGGKAGFGSKGLGNAITSAQGAQSKANLARAQRIASGATFFDSASNWMHSSFGALNKFQLLDNEVSSLNDLKSDVEGEDIVKDAQATFDLAYQQYFESARASGQTPVSKSVWRDTIGKSYDDAIKDAKDKAFSDLLSKNASFQAKVDMHNKRFGTRYGSGIAWRDINDFRKDRAGRLEELRARKPKS